LIVEDAAQALGATDLDEPVGSCSRSTMAILSFHPVKHITTAEGGAVLTNDAELAAGLRRFRDHGIDRQPRSDGTREPWSYELVELGYNYRITDLQCALGLVQLGRLGEFVERRRAIAEVYQRAFAAHPALELTAETPGARSSYHLYVVRVREDRLAVGRREVFEALRAENIGVQVHYSPIHLQPLYREKYGHRPGDFPVAEDFYRRCLSLPLFPGMSDRDVHHVIAAVEKVLEYYSTDAR
jgi:dTDP-4-amino-4,6-dideoxygalactose transaminase